MNLLEALDASGQHFLRLAESLDRDEFSAASVCVDWTIGDVVEHVIGGCRMSVALANGASAADAAQWRERSIAEPLAHALREAISEQRVALGAGRSADDIIHHPIVDMTITQLIETRVVEFIVHGSDLARSLGRDDEIDASLAEVAWAAMAPLADVTGALGVFGSGPSGQLGDDATAAEHLLDVTGRGPVR